MKAPEYLTGRGYLPLILRRYVVGCNILKFSLWYLSFRECTHVHHQKKPVTIKVTGFYLTNPIVKNC